VIRLHPDDLRQLARLVSQISLSINGRQLDTAVSYEAMRRG
jgi:hypothetical protein